MFKVTTKKGSLFFTTIDELCLFLERMGTSLVEDGSYIKISFVEDF